MNHSIRASVNRAAMLLQVLMLVMLAGCTNSDRARIVGKWQIDQIENVSEKVSFDDGNTASMSQKMTIEFVESGRLRTETRIGSIDSIKEGTWTFLDYENESGLMRVECTLGMQKTEHEIRFEDAETIEWIPPNLAGTSQKVRFVRTGN